MAWRTPTDVEIAALTCILSVAIDVDESGPAGRREVAA